MVEKVPKYAFKSNRVGLLGTVTPYVNTDVTNPRELYAMLSESRPQGALLTSVKVNSQAGAKLPPLDISEMPFRGSLKRQSQHSSYPDLASCRSEKASSSDHLPVPVRRSSSLQDLHSFQQLGPAGTQAKKLKPILRDHNAVKNVHEHVEKAGVKFGQKEVHLIRDSPLPPIEGVVSTGKGGLSLNFSLDQQHEEKDNKTSSHSPRSHHTTKRHGAAELSSDIFPRGQPVEVKKPVTPTYDDYPEAYWELRSPTVQDPSDLKDDMIDRDRYRLQQISSLRLRAMNREVIANKLDTYRKWQQQMLAQSPSLGVASKQESARSSVTPTMNGSTPSARAGKQLRMSMSLQNDALAVAATSVNPNYNPLSKKRLENRKTPGHALQTDSYGLSEDELRRRQKIEAAARGENGEDAESETKPVKVTVVNLCMDPDRSSSSPTSEVYTGIRRIMFGPPRPPSEKGKTQFSSQTSLQAQDQESGSGTHVPRPPGSASLASHNATLGSSHSHRLTSAPSVPTHSVADGSTIHHGRGDTTDADSSVTSKKTLTKFKKLQVFSEKYPNNALAESRDAARPKPTADKTPYLPQSRPPTYKLDLRNYPIRHYDPTERVTRMGLDLGIVREGVDGLPLLSDGGSAIPHLRNPSPTKSEVTFRFSNGEVIVSRQGKRPSAT